MASRRRDPCRLQGRKRLEKGEKKIEQSGSRAGNFSIKQTTAIGRKLGTIVTTEVALADGKPHRSTEWAHELFFILMAGSSETRATCPACPTCLSCIARLRLFG